MICFANGTQILTPTGETAVEDLRIGDVVVTAENGNKEILWIGRVTVKAKGKYAPVRIAAGALGSGQPTRDLLVSPAHRMVISGWRSELLFDLTTVFVPASALINDSTITFARDKDTVEYFHIMFDSHEIVFANGTQSESFNPSLDAIDNLSGASRQEFSELFPDLVLPSAKYSSAVPTLSMAEAFVLTKLS